MSKRRPPKVRKSGMGSVSTGGSGRNRYPKGVYVALANASNCLKVGLLAPDSQSARFGKVRESSSNVFPERSRAHRSMESLTSTRIVPSLHRPLGIQFNMVHTPTMIHHTPAIYPPDTSPHMPVTPPAIGILFNPTSKPFRRTRRTSQIQLVANHPISPLRFFPTISLRTFFASDFIAGIGVIGGSIGIYLSVII